MANTSTVLILGARGRLGWATARAFSQAGWTVLAHTRPGANLPEALPNVQCLSHDLADSAGLVAAARGAQVVVHALNPIYTQKSWREQAPVLMQQGIALAQAMQATLMLPGNVYNFGTGMPALLTEHTAQNGNTVKGQVRIAMERQMEQAAQQGDIKAVVIRAGDFFGSGKGSWFDQLICKDLRKGKFSYPGPLNVPTAWAYLPDLARSFVEVAQRREALPAFTNLHFAGYSLTGQQWLDALTQIARSQLWLGAGVALKPSGMPWPLIRAGALLVPTWAALVEMAYLWQTPHALDGSKLAALTGGTTLTPFAQAVRASMGQLGMLADAVPTCLEGEGAAV